MAITCAAIEAAAAAKITASAAKFFKQASMTIWGHSAAVMPNTIVLSDGVIYQ
jgi:hypothetical protein